MIVYVADLLNWSTTYVSNLIVAKLIQNIYPDRPLVPSNFAERDVQDFEMHKDMDSCSFTAPTKPAFDAEFWSLY